MAIKMVRQPGETSNINNIDDIIPFRYAYGNQNGYVVGKGAELDYSLNGSNFIINSGRVVIQGVESDIDANGVTFTIDNIATTRYYIVYNEVNLATNESSIKLVYDTATYPTITLGDDLNEFPSGIARMTIYKFSAINGVINNVEKLIQPIKYAKDIEVENSKKVNGFTIKKDQNGVFTIDDVIIPQKKVIQELNVLVKPTITSDSMYGKTDINFELKEDKRYQLEFSIWGNSSTLINGAELDRVLTPTAIAIKVGNSNDLAAICEGIVNRKTYYVQLVTFENGISHVQVVLYGETSSNWGIYFRKIYEVIE